MPPTSDILALESRLRSAMLASDVATLDELLAPDLAFAIPSGHVIGKQDDLQTHRSGALKFSRLDFGERHVQAWGDTVVVLQAATVEGQMQGQAFGGGLHFMRVWRLRDGRWQVVAGQSSQGAG